MKKTVAIMLLGAAVMLSACDKKKVGLDDLSYEAAQELKKSMKEEIMEEIKNEKKNEAQEAQPAPQQKPQKKAVPSNSVASLREVSNNASSTCEFSYLSTVRLSYDDIAGLSGSDLRILRNAIYAMHGYKFNSADLRSYFSQFGWYSPRYANVESRLNSIERANVQLIRSCE